MDQSGHPANLLEADRQRFGGLAEAHRRALRLHCYRMLGSLQEADEMVQETFRRAWDSRATYQGRAPFRAWLYKIATNLCIDELRRRPRRLLPAVRREASSPADPIPAPLSEPVWLEPYPDKDLPSPVEAGPEARYSSSESVRLAFMILLQLLPPSQRAVLILRDVLGWQAGEVAEALGQTIPAVKSALYRARTTLAHNRPLVERELLPSRMDDETLRLRLESYMRAWQDADVDRLVLLLIEDSAFSMPPTPGWYRGRQDIAALVSRTIFSGPAHRRWRLLPTRANAAPAFGLYKLNESEEAYTAYGLQVLALADHGIASITTFRLPRLVALFGLPEILPAHQPR